MWLQPCCPAHCNYFNPTLLIVLWLFEQINSILVQVMTHFPTNYDYDPGSGGPIDLREEDPPLLIQTNSVSVQTTSPPLSDHSSLQYQLAVATLLAQQATQTKALILAAAGALSAVCGTCVTCLSSHSAALAIGAAVVACGFPVLLAGLYSFYTTRIQPMHLHIQ